MSQINAVLRAIGDNPGATIEEFAKAMRTHPSKVRNHVHQAKHQGWASMRMDDVTHKPGYHLTDTGKAKLANAAAKPAKAAEVEATAATEKAPATAPADTSDDAANAASLLAIIYDIRCALGDSEGRIMLGEIAETIQAREKQRTELAVSLQSARLEAEEHRVAHGRMHIDHWKLTEQLGDTHDALAHLLPPDWPIDPSDMATADIINQIAATLAALRTAAPATPADDAIDIHDAATGYIVSAAKRKPRRINCPGAARAAALAAVRNGAQRAEVFALVPIGSAKRGAQWDAK